MNIRDRLTRLFQQEFDLPPDAVVETLAYQQQAGWDSVGHMRLVAAVETEFNLLLTTDQILDFGSFAKGLDILQAHGVADAG